MNKGEFDIISARLQMLTMDLIYELERQEYLETTKALPDKIMLCRMNELLRVLVRHCSRTVLTEHIPMLGERIYRVKLLLWMVRKLEGPKRDATLRMVQSEIQMFTQTI